MRRRNLKNAADMGKVQARKRRRCCPKIQCLHLEDARQPSPRQMVRRLVAGASRLWSKAKSKPRSKLTTTQSKSPQPPAATPLLLAMGCMRQRRQHLAHTPCPHHTHRAPTHHCPSPRAQTEQPLKPIFHRPRQRRVRLLLSPRDS